MTILLCRLTLFPISKPRVPIELWLLPPTGWQRRNLMSPVVVRTFKIGPPPFSLPQPYNSLGPPVPALAAHANSAEVGENLVAVGQIDAGAHGDCDIGSQ